VKNWIDQSRDLWGNGDHPTNDGLKVGCLQRIATAMERIEIHLRYIADPGLRAKEEEDKKLEKEYVEKWKFRDDCARVVKKKVSKALKSIGLTLGSAFVGGTSNLHWRILNKHGANRDRALAEKLCEEFDPYAYDYAELFKEGNLSNIRAKATMAKLREYKNGPVV
jgi:hypothetical protein